MSKRWHIRPHDPDRIAALQRAAGIPAVVAQLLICRGITEPHVREAFLIPSFPPCAIRNACPAARKPPAASTRPSPPRSGSSSTAITTSTA